MAATHKTNSVTAVVVEAAAEEEVLTASPITIPPFVLSKVDIPNGFVTIVFRRDTLAALANALQNCQYGDGTDKYIPTFHALGRRLRVVGDLQYGHKKGTDINDLTGTAYNTIAETYIDGEPMPSAPKFPDRSEQYDCPPRQHNYNQNYNQNYQQQYQQNYRRPRPENPRYPNRFRNQGGYPNNNGQPNGYRNDGYQNNGYQHSGQNAGYRHPRRPQPVRQYENPVERYVSDAAVDPDSQEFHFGRNRE